jgi:hypothetical protein
MALPHASSSEDEEMPDAAAVPSPKLVARSPKQTAASPKLTSVKASPKIGTYPSPNVGAYPLSPTTTTATSAKQQFVLEKKAKEHQQKQTNRAAAAAAAVPKDKPDRTSQINHKATAEPVVHVTLEQSTEEPKTKKQEGCRSSCARGSCDGRYGG